MSRTVHTLPDSYQQVLHFDVMEPKVLLRLNFLALIPLVIAAFVVLRWADVAAALRAQWFPSAAASTEEAPALLCMVIAILVVLPLHEAIHGAAIALYGHRPRFGMKLSSGLLYATADKALFWRNQYLAVALAPLVVITITGLLLMIPAYPVFGYLVSVAVVINAGGAIGDLWFSWILRRFPADVLVRDEADGFTIFKRAPVSV